MMGQTLRCPHCGYGIDLGDGFNGPGYIDDDGKPFDPYEKEQCPLCGKPVKKNEWGEFVMLWD
jgi:rubrerythrin